MNVLGHTYVATAWPSDDPSFLLGAVLPDLASMARVRLDASARAGSLGDGIRCHHRVDLVFHADLSFRSGSGAIRDDLLAEGIPTGPSRAIGHAGWELLLDGTLVGTGIEDAFHRSIAHAPDAVDAVSAGDRERWLAFATERSPAPSLRYDDPEWVAQRMYWMLEHRPRLRLATHDITKVAVVLGRHADRVRTDAPDVLSRTTQAARTEEPV